MTRFETYESKCLFPLKNMNIVKVDTILEKIQLFSIAATNFVVFFTEFDENKLGYMHKLD